MSAAVLVVVVALVAIILIWLIVARIFRSGGHPPPPSREALQSEFAQYVQAHGWVLVHEAPDQTVQLGIRHPIAREALIVQAASGGIDGIPTHLFRCSTNYNLSVRHQRDLRYHYVIAEPPIDASMRFPIRVRTRNMGDRWWVPFYFGTQQRQLPYTGFDRSVIAHAERPGTQILDDWLEPRFRQWYDRVPIKPHVYWHGGKLATAVEGYPGELSLDELLDQLLSLHSWLFQFTHSKIRDNRFFSNA